MEYFKDGKIVLNLEAEKGQKVWMVGTYMFEGKKYVAMLRDIFGDMTIDEGNEELLEQEKFTEEEAEKKCLEWAKKLGLECINV